jgi:hypothetical protein
MTTNRAYPNGRLNGDDDGIPITIGLDEPVAAAELEWVEFGDQHHLLLPNSISQIGIRMLRLELAPAGWVVVVRGYTHQVNPKVLSDETRFILSHLALEDAKLAAIDRLRQMIQSAVEALPESSGGAR